MKAFVPKALAMLAAALCVGLALVWPGPTQAQMPQAPIQIRPDRPIVRPPQLTLRNANQTRFDPALHGFRFANTFANNFIPEFDIRTDGLCGGMVFAALDYFYNPSIPLPTQDYEPGEGAVLRTYLYHRQTNSIVDHNHVRWSELGFNPFGTRNAEFYRWGLEGRLQELKREIDAGRPVPLGLKGCNEGCNGDHQVLAIGYDFGAYDGDPANNELARQVRIRVYDPNHPGRTMTLTPFTEADLWRYSETGERWRTYFIAAYSTRTPPRISQAPRELLLILSTGGDDLRGGNDNLNVQVFLRNGSSIRFTNVNNGRRWVNNSDHTVSLALPEGVTPTDVRGVVLETVGSRESWNRDNWNLDRIVVQGRGEGAPAGDIFRAEGTPLFRFTLEQPRRSFGF